jgi:DNA-binding transcriptional LysR family regulator
LALLLPFGWVSKAHATKLDLQVYCVKVIVCNINLLRRQLYRKIAEGVTLAYEPMLLVESRNSNDPRTSKLADFYSRHWVLNSVGCLVREEIKHRVEQLGVPLVIAAELHNPDLQLSLVAGNVGLGMLRSGFLRRHPMRSQVRVIKHPNFKVSIRIAFFRARHLGTRAQAALELQRILLKHFGSRPL